MARRLLIHMAVAAGILMFSAIFVLVFANSKQVSCRHSGGGDATCSITTALLGRWPTSSRVVAGVTGVEMDKTCDDGCAYRAVLVTSQGERVPLNDVYTDAEIVRPQVSAVQEFLAGSAPSLEYGAPVPWWVVALMLGLDVVGLGMVVANLFKR